MPDRPIGSQRIRHLYREIKIANGPNGWRLEHQLIAEKKYNRKLRQGEIVHHIDGNRLNNQPNNLIIMENGQHTILHVKGSKQSEESNRKRSISHMNLIRTEEHCRNISKSKMGHIVSPETRIKISNSLMGQKHTEEYNQRQSIIITQWWKKRKQELSNVGV